MEILAFVCYFTEAEARIQINLFAEQTILGFIKLSCIIYDLS